MSSRSSTASPSALSTTPRSDAVDLGVTVAIALSVLWSLTLDNADAVTLLGVTGTDISPTGAADIANSILNILTNWIAPLGGLALLGTAGASFARNRASGISAGPAALAVGGTVMILSPALTAQLMTSAGAGATFGPMVDVGQFSMSINPILVASYLATRYFRRG